MKEIKTNKRDWLNPVTSSDEGSVQTSTSISGMDFAVTMTLRDCSKSIYLDFGVNCPRLSYLTLQKTIDKRKNDYDKQVRDRQKKIQIIRNHLDVIDKQLTLHSELVADECEKEIISILAGSE